MRLEMIGKLLAKNEGGKSVAKCKCKMPPAGYRIHTHTHENIILINTTVANAGKEGVLFERRPLAQA
jgi:hypothetical protein